MNSNDFTNTSQSFDSLFNKSSQYTRQKTKMDLLHILNQTQNSNEARIQNMELTKAKQHIQCLANDAVIKTHKMRENQLLQQIETLREDVQMMEKHFLELNQKYTEKREEAHQYMEQAMEVNQKYDLLTQKYLNLEEKYKKREKQIVEKFNLQFESQSAQFEEKNTLSNMKIKQLETNNKQLLELLKSAEKQNSKLKQVQDIQRTKRKCAQEAHKKQVQEMRDEIQRQRVQLTILRRQVQEKQSQVIQKDQNVKSMAKSMRQMSQRVVKIEKDTQKEILKEKVKAQKALDGLKMTRKYSQLELSKSRKKQKYYMHSQKELLEKVKQIVKDQNLIDTMDKSTKRGESTKSLNTTLKIIKGQRQSSSPFVSNFMVDDDSIVELSPINKMSQNKNLNVSNYHSTGVSSHRNSSRAIGITKCRVQIPAGLSIAGYHGAGTPCFESQKGQMFKAHK